VQSAFFLMAYLMEESISDTCCIKLMQKNENVKNAEKSLW